MKLINDYIQTTIQNAIDSGIAKLRDTDYITNSDNVKITIPIGKIRVCIYKNECMLDIGEQRREDGPSVYIKLWKNDVGGLLLRDMKHGNKNLYKEIVIGNVTKCLVRQMTEDEAEASARAGKPYSIVVIKKDEEKEYYCIIKVIEYKNGYHEFGENWYSDIYDPTSDEALRKRLEKEDRMLEYEEEKEQEEEERRYADLGLTDYEEPTQYDE